MRVKYRRSGGIASIKIEREFDSASLPKEHAAALNHLLKKKSSTRPSHPDEFIHELQTSNKNVRLLDSQLAPEALTFFDYLTQRRKDAKK